MKQEDDTLKTAFEEELKAIENNPILSAKFRRQKTIMWTIRTLIAIILYFIFWKHQWVRWTLIAYIPLNLLSLFSIYGTNAILKKKIAKTKAKVEAMEATIKDDDN